MHAVLHNSDLLVIICKFVLGPTKPSVVQNFPGSAALLSLALVCRNISWIALSTLWRSVDIHALYFTFPEDIVFTDEDGMKSWNLKTITPKQWSRFDIYARYIHHISVIYFFEDPGIKGLCEALGRHPHSQSRFPRLEVLTLCSSISHLRDTVIFLCPTLIDITITISLELGTDDKSHRNVADFLEELGRNSMVLKNLRYFDDSKSMRPAIFENSLAHLIHHLTRLQTVEVPLSRGTLIALAQLPSLTHLRLYGTSWSAGQMPEIGIIQNKWQDEQDMFILLEELVLALDYPWPSHLIKGLFRGLDCNPRKFEASISPTTSARLEATEFAQFFEDIFNRRQYSWPQSVGLEEFSLSCGGSGCIAAWRSFYWLFCLPDLQRVHFQDLYFDVTDSDLEEMTKMWRKLRSLRFVGCHPLPEGYESQVTFAGLAHLSQLPELRELSLMLNTSAEISSPMLSTKSLGTSPLITLEIRGEFPKVTIIDATLFFAKHFPNLKEIIAGGSEKSRKQWGEVEAGLYSAQQTLALLSIRNA